MISEFQNFSLALYTNRNIRTDFFNNPRGLLKKYNLTERERTALMKLNRTQLEEFADGLSTKRAALAEKLLAQNPDAVITSNFYIKGPVIFFKEDVMRAEAVSEEVYLLFSRIKKRIRFRAFFTLQLFAKNISLPAYWQFIKIILKHNLIGKNITQL